MSFCLCVSFRWVFVNFPVPSLTGACSQPPPEEAEEPFVLSDEEDDDGDGEVEDKEDAADVDGVKVTNEEEKDNDQK